MKTKSNLKRLLLVTILLITVCLFNTNIVLAEVDTNDTFETPSNPTTTENSNPGGTDESDPSNTPGTNPDGQGTTPSGSDPAESQTTPPSETTEDSENQGGTSQSLATISGELFNRTISSTITVSKTKTEFVKAYLEAYVPGAATNSATDELNVEIKAQLLTMFQNAGIEIAESEASMLDVRATLNTAYVSLNVPDSDIFYTKSVTIKYAQENNYSADDEKIVKDATSILGSYVWIAYELGDSVPETWSKIFDDFMKDFMKNSLTDKNISYIITCEGLSASDYWTSGTDVTVYFFKNDICYDVRDMLFEQFRMLTIPDDVRDTDQAYIGYALPQITKALNELGLKDFKVEKQQGNNQWYNILAKYPDGEYYTVDSILLKKENTFKVADWLTISADENVTLSAEPIEEKSDLYKEMQDKLSQKGFKDIFNAYEIELIDGNLGDGLDLTFDVGTENNGRKAIILHKKHDGTYEEFERTVENGRVTVTVTELSPFMIALAGRKLDNEPNTGVADYTIFASAIAFISLAGLVTLKFKK